MASVFKRDDKWVASFKGADGKWKGRVAGTDKGEALRLANHWEEAARQRREGLVDPKAEGYKAAGERGVTLHLEDYEADLKARGRTATHASLTASRAGKLLAKAKVLRITDIRPAAINSALSELKIENDLSATSVSHYLRAMKLFSRWLSREGRTREDALSGVSVKVAIAKADRKHVRRALAQDEFAALARHVANAPTRFGMSGADRAMLYRVAVGSGLRASELASLKPESFALAGDEPCITVAAGYSKRGKRSGRDDVQPINTELAVGLTEWLKGKPKGRAVFTMPPIQHVAEMLKADLRTARARWVRETSNGKERRKRGESAFLLYRDESDAVVDFHALRHTYVSWIVASGAAVSVCQQLARHSTPTLTIGVYSHPTLADNRRALDALPGMKPPVRTERTAMRATGTDDTQSLPGTSETRQGSAERALKADGVFVLRMAQHDASKMGLGGVHGTAGIAGENAQDSMIAGVLGSTGRSGIRTHEKRICNPSH